METSNIKLEKLRLKLAEKERAYQDIIKKLNMKSIYKESDLSSASAVHVDKNQDLKGLYSKHNLDLKKNSANYDSSKDFDDLDSIVSNKSNKGKSKDNEHKKDLEDLVDDIYDYDDDDDDEKRGKAFGLLKKGDVIAESSIQEELFLLEKLSRIAEMIANAEDHYEFMQLLDKESKKIQKELQDLKDANQKARAREKFEHNIGVLEGMLMLMDDKSSMREATEIQISAYRRMLAWVS